MSSVCSNTVIFMVLIGRLITEYGDVLNREVRFRRHPAICYRRESDIMKSSVRKIGTNKRTLKVAIIGVLCALAFVAVAVFRIPLIPSMAFLKYDPKDVVITFAGLSLGPAAAAVMTVIVSFIEMITVSESGIIGFVMNVLSTASFACVASLIYKKRHSFRGAVAGLCTGWAFMLVVMLLWNWLITPLYMNLTREAVEKLLVPSILPFNFVKGGFNTALTMIIYKPASNVLKHTGLSLGSGDETGISENSGSSRKLMALWIALPIAVVCAAVLVLVRVI